MIKKILSTLIMSLLFFSQTLFAENSTEVERTIMIYICGSDLESYGGSASFNIDQILSAKFSKDEKVKVVVMTGGSWDWWLESEYLFDPQNPGVHVTVSTEYNQIWEAKGADSEYLENGHGKLVLLDRDGVSGDGILALPSEEELMSDPNTLRGFINYSVQHFPAKKYGLILWDHGDGVIGSYGLDEHSFNPFNEDEMFKLMSFADILDALSNNDVINGGKKFDFINFDACLMNNVEFNIAISEFSNYYIASAETEPAYGQDYKGWLDALGNNPNLNTFELGKIVVDDFISFYEMIQEGQVTLAVVDLQKLITSNFIPALNEISNILKREISARGADGSFLYYDELGAANNSIFYSLDDKTKRDVGNFAGQLPIILKEVSTDSLVDGTYTPINDYSNAASQIAGVLEDSSIIYSRTSNDYFTEPLSYLDKNRSLGYAPLTSSGMYIFFPSIENIEYTVQYKEAMEAALPFIQNQEKRELLDKYLENVIDYTVLLGSGNAVAELIESGVQKNEINYNKVKEYWQGLMLPKVADNAWHYIISKLFDENDDAKKEWLGEIIEQQKGDAVSVDNVTVKKVLGRRGDGYKVEINDTNKRIIESVTMMTDAEVPASVQYFQTFFGNDYNLYSGKIGFHLNDVDAVQDTTGLQRDLSDPIEKLLSDYLKWYTERRGVWNFTLGTEKIYAIKDATGVFHAADVDISNAGQAIVNAQFQEASLTNPNNKVSRGVFLYFEKDGDGDEYKLIKVAISNDRGRSVMVSDLQRELEDIRTSYHINFNGIKLSPPLSNIPFTLTRDNAASIRLIPVDINELNDFADVNGDGEKLKRKIVIKDMYSHVIDISEKLAEAEGDIAGALFNIDLADVESVTYNGGVQGPKVVHNGTVLQENVDYTIKWPYDYGECENVGRCEATLFGKGKYTGWVDVEYDVYAKELTPEVVLSVNAYTYNGKERTPNVIVKDGETVLDPSNYTVTYDLGRKNVGKYNVTVALQGNYSGNSVATFQINPKGTSIKKLKKGKNKITVIWNKQGLKMANSRITGYQIEISSKKNFSSNKKIIRVDGFKKVQKKNISVKGKKCFVRIRTYKKVNNVRFYSPWSGVRSIKIAN